MVKHRPFRQSFLPSIGCTLLLTGLLDLVASPALAQQSRADEMAQKQAEKSAQLTPNTATGTERALNWFESHFTDEMIRAAVRTGQYSNPAAEKHIADTLIARRDAIGRAWLTDVNPVIDPLLDASGTLSFRNAAVLAGVANAPASYQVAWFAFDNQTGTATPIGQPLAATREEASAPPGVPSGAGSFVRVDIRAVSPPHPSWAIPVHAYFQRATAGWKLVGFERLPDGAPR